MEYSNLVSTTNVCVDFYSYQNFSTQRYLSDATLMRGTSTPQDNSNRLSCIRRSLYVKDWQDSKVTSFLLPYVRPQTNNTNVAGKNGYFNWCSKWKTNPFSASGEIVVQILISLMSNKVSYSVVNTHKSILINTLPQFGVLWVKEPLLLSKLMKGYFNLNPSRPTVRTSWDV